MKLQLFDMRLAIEKLLVPLPQYFDRVDERRQDREDHNGREAVFIKNALEELPHQSGAISPNLRPNAFMRSSFPLAPRSANFWVTSVARKASHVSIHDFVEAASVSRA
jgi:hypothetical protein